MKEEITSKNFKTKLDSELIKKSQRCTVRECDEVSPSDFESYVDEHDQSYDVRIQLEKGTVINSTCECKSAFSFCQHKIALLAFIAKGIKPAAKITATKKIDPVKQALEQADPEKIRDWILKTLKKNKDLSIAFMNEFSGKSENYTPEEVIALTHDAVKAVIGKRRKAEAFEVKKIIDLWMELHKPILDQYFAEPANEEYFKQVHTIIDTVIEYKYRILTGSKRFETYFKQVLTQIEEVILNIRDEETCIKCLSYFSKEFFLDGYGGIRREYTNIFINIFNSSSIQMRYRIVSIIAEIYRARKDERVEDSKELLQLLLHMVVFNKNFPEYKDMFRPIRHAIVYNIRLIDALIELGELNTAETYCIEQINQNTDSRYDLDYISRLKRIYTQTKDDEKLVGVLSRELLHKPDFDNYTFVISNIEHDAQFKKWRNQVLANARQLASFNKNAADFSLALRNSEGDFKGLLAYLDENADYDSIALYTNQLILYSAEAFMRKLITKIDSGRDERLNLDNPAELEEILEKIYQIAALKYGVENLMLIIKDRVKVYERWANLFVRYVGRKSSAS
ncbi:SWIM zinc finger family protein [Pedobacter soli]|uniref:SWIM-type domain-containing protein n=1 Tax=Pedobacter soli TaxID=390242 RepID=A0A1G6WZQ6_9SPHI|nr:hypothetical protein [Pedobacter soli]SDD70516.1 hypothetical protein SAMN04488024_107155 [Pedobacter soli]